MGKRHKLKKTQKAVCSVGRHQNQYFLFMDWCKWVNLAHGRCLLISLCVLYVLVIYNCEISSSGNASIQVSPFFTLTSVKKWWHIPIPVARALKWNIGYLSADLVLAWYAKRIWNTSKKPPWTLGQGRLLVASAEAIWSLKLRLKPFGFV